MKNYLKALYDEQYKGILYLNLKSGNQIGFDLPDNFVACTDETLEFQKNGRTWQVNTNSIEYLIFNPCE